MILKRLIMMTAYCLALSVSSALFMQQNNVPSDQNQTRKIVKAKSRITLRSLVQSNRTEDQVIECIISKDLKITQAQLTRKHKGKTVLDLIREKKFSKLLNFLAQRFPLVVNEYLAVVPMDNRELLNSVEAMSNFNNNNNNNNNQNELDFDMSMHDGHQTFSVMFSENIVPIS